MREINEEVTVNNSKIIEFIDDDEEQKIIVFLKQRKPKLQKMWLTLLRKKQQLSKILMVLLNFLLTAQRTGQKLLSGFKNGWKIHLLA